MPEALPSQQLISVEQIRDGVAVVRGGGLRLVLETTGVNFALKSEAEQNALLAAFQEFLASLDFSIQFVVHSRRVNIDKYLAGIAAQTEKETNELLKLQTQEYLNFIRSFVELYSVMDKKFFVVVPYDPAIQKEVVTGGIAKLLKRGQAPVVETKYSDEEFSRHLSQIETRRDQIIGGLERLGIALKPLGTEELIELFYNFYNPVAREKESERQLA